MREHVRDRLHEPSVLKLALEGHAGLDRDRQERDAGDVPEEERPPPDTIDEEEDHRRHGEHHRRCHDVHDRDVVDAPSLHEERIRSELADPVGRHHERQQRVQEETEAPLAALKGKRIARDAP